MKNSKEYSKKITNLYQSLKKKNPKVQSITFNQVVDSIIHGIICEKFSERDTEAAIKRFSAYFVDWNDLRVSRLEEIAEILGADTPENRQIALTLTKVLQRIFNENHQISLESLQKLGKRQARQKLEKIEDLSKFVIDYCMLTSMDSHAIPLTENMIEYLKSNDLVEEEADEPTLEGFLSKQISAKNGYEFYILLKHESETEKHKTKTGTSQRSKKASTKSVPAKAVDEAEKEIETKKTVPHSKTAAIEEKTKKK